MAQYLLYERQEEKMETSKTKAAKGRRRFIW